MIDLVGDIIVELREDLGVSALVGNRVRGQEPEGASPSYPGDARGPGEYVAFVVIVVLDATPMLRVPVQRPSFGVRCYGTDARNARAVFNAVVGALHDRGPRLRANGHGIYRSTVTGGADDVDPKTDQPVVTGTIQLVATTQAVTV